MIGSREGGSPGNQREGYLLLKQSRKGLGGGGRETKGKKWEKGMNR